MKLLFYTFLFLIVSINCLAQIESNSLQQIPIIGWYGIPSSESTEERFKEQRACGITHNFTVYNNLDEIAVALDAAQKGGIKLIIQCSQLMNYPEEVVMRFKDHPALAGYSLLDEPGPDLFPSLANLIRRIQVLDEKNFCYVNLLPNYATKEMLGGKTYEDYIDSYIKKVPTPFLSFDNYPIIKSSFGKRSLRPEWYKNLEIVSSKSQNANKRFWAFVLTVAHWSYPIPTLTDIRLQAFTNLAYGAQGIQYFTYWTPESNSTIDFHNGPINNLNNKRTEVYDLMKLVNNEIKNLSWLFIDSKVLSVWHTGSTIPEGTKRLNMLPPAIKKLKTKGGGALVSLVKKNDNTFLVIINRDLTKEMTLTIQGNYPLKKISKNGNYYDLQLKEEIVNLEAGDMIIYSWNK